MLRELEADVLGDEVDRDEVVAALPRDDDVGVAFSLGLGFGCVLGSFWVVCWVCVFRRAFFGCVC